MNTFREAQISGNFAIDGEYNFVPVAVVAAAPGILKGIKAAAPVLKKIGSLLTGAPTNTIKLQLSKLPEEERPNRLAEFGLFFKSKAQSLKKMPRFVVYPFVRDYIEGLNYTLAFDGSKKLIDNLKNIDKPYVEICFNYYVFSISQIDEISKYVDIKKKKDAEIAEAKVYVDDVKKTVPQKTTTALAKTEQAKQLAQSQKSTTKTASSTTIKTLPSQYNSFGAWLKSLIKL